jgi:hypothetical protein
VWGEYFAGLIDEVRIYDRALSASEILADMNAPVENPPADSEAPNVSLATPSIEATISHVAVISATATDNVAIAYVEFFVDDESVGIDVDAPYSINWNTTTYENGVHELIAVAADVGGNQATSEAITVTTLNPAFVNEVVVPNILDATTIAFLPDGRLLVGELTNKILLVPPGANQPDVEPLLNLDYTYQFGEQGLMDIAIDPGFSENGYFYVYYTKGFRANKITIGFRDSP